MVTALLVFFVLLGIWYAFTLFRDIGAHRGEGNESYPIAFIIGGIANFFDTLGIGSFALTTLAFKLTNYLDTDEKLPGTLNVANTIPVLLQAFLFINVVEVEFVTLITLILSAMIGSVVGARFITKAPEKQIQLIVGLALIITAGIMAARQANFIEGLGEGNTAIGLSTGLLVIGAVIHFILGALMSAGVGLYAPSMAVIYMLGLNPLVAFPIMMGACAALMPTASVSFIKAGKYSRRGSLGILIGGIIGVLAAFYLVTEIDLVILTRVIVGVVCLTGMMMLVRALRRK